MSNTHLRAVLLGAAISATLSLSVSAEPARVLSVPVVYYGAADSSAHNGIQQGLDEANLQGRFLGQRYRLSNASPDQPGASMEAAALLTAVDAETLKKLSSAAPDTPIFNLTLDADDLRAACLPNVLHVQPSQAMKADALRQWRKLHPDSSATAYAWHHAFEKYSGIQLNTRFRKSQGRDMDDAAWAGWAAVKMLSDSVARAGSTAPRRLHEYLRTELKFDGQKGIEMNFRSDGQLRQVVLLVEGGKIVGEAPVKGVAELHDLDSLGIASPCDTTRSQTPQ
jgi:hypothetical protein